MYITFNKDYGDDDDDDDDERRNVSAQVHYPSKATMSVNSKRLRIERKNTNPYINEMTNHSTLNVYKKDDKCKLPRIRGYQKRAFH